MILREYVLFLQYPLQMSAAKALKLRRLPFGKRVLLIPGPLFFLSVSGFFVIPLIVAVIAGIRLHTGRESSEMKEERKFLSSLFAVRARDRWGEEIDYSSEGRLTPGQMMVLSVLGFIFLQIVMIGVIRFFEPFIASPALRLLAALPVMMAVSGIIVYLLSKIGISRIGDR